MGAEWYTGLVTQTNPVEVRFEDGDDSCSHEWDNIRKHPSARIPVVLTREYDWSCEGLAKSTSELVDAALAQNGGDAQQHFLILCADCVFVPLYGKESILMLCSALKCLLATFEIEDVPSRPCWQVSIERPTMVLLR